MRGKFHWFAAAAMTFVGTVACQAMTITVRPRDSVDVANKAPVSVYLSGRIESDTPAQVNQVLDGIKGQRISVYLDSPGGSLMGGMEIGRLLRARNATTTVGAKGEKFKSKPGACLSACSHAFIGGAFRYMAPGSTFGVHRAFLTGGPGASDVDIGQAVSAASAAYYREMGVDPELLTLSMKAGKNGMYVLNKAELTSLRVVNNGRKPPEWTIEGVEGATSLKGVQETSRGTGTALFACKGGTTGFTSLYTAGDQAQSIARKGWVHSLLIDRHTVTLPAPAWTRVNGIEVSSLFPALPTPVVKQILTSDRVGHAMRLTGEALSYVGYTVEIDSGNRNRVRSYLRNCLSAK